MNIYLVYWHAEGFFNMVADSVGNTAGNWFDSGSIFDDNIHINDDIFTIVLDINPLSGVFN